MYRLAIVFSCTFPFAAGSATEMAGPGEPASRIEKLVKAYGAKHGLARDWIEPWKSALAPDGRACSDDARVRFVQVIKGKSGIEPTTYIGEHVGSPALRVVMPVDEDGYVTDFRVWNIR